MVAHIFIGEALEIRDSGQAVGISGVAEFPGDPGSFRIHFRQRSLVNRVSQSIESHDNRTNVTAEHQLPVTYQLSREKSQGFAADGAVIIHPAAFPVHHHEAELLRQVTPVLRISQLDHRTVFQHQRASDPIGISIHPEGCLQTVPAVAQVGDHAEHRFGFPVRIGIRGENDKGRRRAGRIRIFLSGFTGRFDVNILLVQDSHGLPGLKIHGQAQIRRGMEEDGFLVGRGRGFFVSLTDFAPGGLLLPAAACRRQRLLLERKQYFCCCFSFARALTDHGGLSRALLILLIQVPDLYPHSLRDRISGSVVRFIVDTHTGGYFAQGARQRLTVFTQHVQLLNSAYVVMDDHGCRGAVPCSQRCCYQDGQKSQCCFPHTPDLLFSLCLRE